MGDGNCNQDDSDEVFIFIKNASPNTHTSLPTVARSSLPSPLLSEGINDLQWLSSWPVNSLA